MTGTATLAVAADTIPPLWRLLTKFGFFAGMAAIAGAAVVHAAVLRPALRETAADPADDTALRRRAALVATGTGLLWLAVLYPQLAGKALRATGGNSFAGALAPQVIWSYLTARAPAGAWIAPGLLVLVTYVLFALAGLLPAVLLLRRRPDLIPATVVPALALGLLVQSTPATTAGMTADGWITAAVECVHPVAGCVWIGGLASMALLSFRAPRGPRSGELWARTWRRFGFVAQVCVGTIATTGLWLAWKEVGAPQQLWQTPFGRFLLVKISLVLTLVLIGAFNEFVLFPRIGRLRAAGETLPVLALTLRRFPRVVVAEAVIGLCVLGIVPFLNGSAREEAGGAAEPPATGALFTAVALLLVVAALAFTANLRLYRRIDHPAAPAAPRPGVSETEDSR